MESEYVSNNRIQLALKARSFSLKPDVLLTSSIRSQRLLAELITFHSANIVQQKSQIALSHKVAPCRVNSELCLTFYCVLSKFYQHAKGIFYYVPIRNSEWPVQNITVVKLKYIFFNISMTFCSFLSCFINRTFVKIRI